MFDPSVGGTWSDYRISASIRSMDDDHLGLIARYQDADNYYRLSWSREESKLQLIKRVNGVTSLLAETNFVYDQGRTYQVEFTLLGTTLEATIDGQLQLSAIDTNLSQGTVALYSWRNSGAYFDDILIEDLSDFAPPPTVALTGTVTLDGAALEGVAFSIPTPGVCSVSDVNGSYNCTVPYGWSGSITPSLAGYTFTPPSRNYTAVTNHSSNEDYSANLQSDLVWVEDALPAGSVQSAVNDSWNWIGTNPAPFSGSLAHKSNNVAGQHLHYFYNASDTLSVNAGDTLIAYVYLDPVNPPAQVMLGWRTGSSWEHRAYWGTNNITYGVDGTNSRRYMGVLPAIGQWVRLEVPAADVGLEGTILNGMAFYLHNGQASWDHAGKQ